MTQNKRMILFFATNVLFNMAASFAHPVTPTIFKNLNLGSYMFGVALAAMMTANFLFSPFWGKINGYISSRVSLLICSCGYALGQLMFGLSKTEPSFMVARAFAGIFTGGCFVSMLTYIVNTTPDQKQRGRYLTITATIQSVCGAFGYFIGGMLGEMSVMYAIIAQVVCLSVSGVLFFIICENDSQIPIAQLKVTTIVKEANPFSAFLASRHFMTPILIIMFAICMFQNLGFTAFDQSFNYYIKDQFNFSSGYNGMLKGVMGFITLAANSTICLWLINRTNLKKSIIGVLFLCSTTMLGVLFFEQIIPFIILNVIFFAFNGMSMPILQNLVAEKSRGSDSNIIMGFYNAMKSLGGIIGALCAGGLYTANPKYPFIFGFLAFTVATLLAVVYYLKHKNASVVE